MSPVTQNERMARVEEQLKGQAVSLSRLEQILNGIDQKLELIPTLYATKDEVKAKVESVELKVDQKVNTARWGWGVGGAVITSTVVAVVINLVK